MTSLFQRVLGRDFDRLHPELRRRFGIGSADGVACIGTGSMDRVWHGRGFTRPFLALGATRNILVPEEGTDVGFTIENYAYLDSFGRESVSFARTFRFAVPRRWNATMIYSPERGTVVDYLGSHQHLAVDLRVSVDERGGLLIRSGQQRFHEGPLTFRVPRIVTGTAEVRESFDDELGRFRIEVAVTNHRFGPLFGYHGTFSARYPECRDVPERVKPVREQART
ncbi:DUF4166 domain-containing protein [Pseudonocardia acaciae]|uniref:DUF4166 domain-containing protein n=1 Tax=Pseudonocardia acaciae TaxID=551276 RepID=UPI000490DE18|nr:DUF4166 domain-containing protein [Pseudonocardia acaciae]